MRKTFLLKSSKRFNYCSEATNAAENYKKQTGDPADVARGGEFWHVSFYHLAETDLPVVPTDAELEYMGSDDRGIEDREDDPYALKTSPTHLAYPEYAWVYRGLDELVREERVYIWPDRNDPRLAETYGGWLIDSPRGALVGWGGGTDEEDQGDMNARDWGDGWDDFDGESWENYLGE